MTYRYLSDNPAPRVGVHLTSERGAVLILTAISLLILTGLCAFVLDMGVMWTARRQAQNAADAGALAAGTALLYDSWGDRSATGPAHLSGVGMATTNQVFGATPGVIVDQAMDANTWDAIAPAPETCIAAPGSCAQANVFRDGTHGSSTLPTYFAQVFGQTSQQTRATATVQLRSANGTECLKPWFGPDKSNVSTYTMLDIGTILPLRYQAGPGEYHQIDIRGSGGTCAGGGANCYRDAIRHCSTKTDGTPWAIGDVIQEKRGNTIGGQVQQEIYDQDPGATWSTSSQSVVGSCAYTRTCSCALTQTCANGMDGTISPRILTIALFRPSDLAQMGSGPVKTAPIVNFTSIFMMQPGTTAPGAPVECATSAENVCGYLLPAPGLMTSGSTPAQGGTLNVVLSLIR